jgi:dTDP-4-amino-4,6-dideoxygalactose transaminase
MGTDPNSVSKLISSKTKLIVAQHSFGIPCEIDKIIKVAKQHDIKVLEDCALSLGSKYKNKILGNWGDAALFSIDHSKPLNCLIGGFLYLKDDNRCYRKVKNYRNNIPNLTKKHQLSLYKQFLFERKYYNARKYSKAKLFELLNRFLKKIRKSDIVFLTDDSIHPQKLKKVNYPYPAKLPPFISLLGMHEVNNFKKNKNYRIELLKNFIQIFKNNDNLNLLPNAYSDKRNEIVPLRLVAYLSANKFESKKYFENIFDISASWFQKPIIECESPEEYGYKNGKCPNSELSATKIINFPNKLEVDLMKNIQYSLDLFLSERR